MTQPHSPEKLIYIMQINWRLFSKIQQPPLPPIKPKRIAKRGKSKSPSSCCSLGLCCCGGAKTGEEKEKDFDLGNEIVPVRRKKIRFRSLEDKFPLFVWLGIDIVQVRIEFLGS